MRIPKRRICRSCKYRDRTAASNCIKCGEKMIRDRERRFIKWGER